MRVLIIGGRGSFGALYANLLKKEGFEIGISSRSEEKGQAFCKEKSYLFSNSVKGFDIVIVSVPNEIAPKTVEEISSKLDEGALLIDFCSVKSQIIPTLEKLSSQRNDLEIASIHPMHGPRVKSLSDIPIIIIPIKTGKKFGSIKEFFEKQSNRIVFSNKEEHDTVLSIVQGLTHYTQFVAANVLKEMNVDLKKTLKFSSPNYSLFMSLMTRVITQNPELYSQIQLENPYNEKVRKVFSKKAIDLENICKKGEKALENNISKTKQLFKSPGKILSKSDKMIEAKE